MKLQNLFRPVGVKELELIKNSNYKAFPPRFDWQPYFYPVLNQDYAIEIASKWNIMDEASGYAGFVTKFRLPLDYLKQFEVQNVGAHLHNELWVPSDQLTAFNQQIVGQIEILNAFYGEGYQGKSIKLPKG